MKILFITGMLPFPLDNGRKLRSFHLIRKLSEGNGLTLFITDEKNPDEKNIGELKKYCKDVKIAPCAELSTPRLILRLFLSIFRKEPFSLLKRYSNRIRQQLHSLIDETRPDVIICDRLTETLYLLDKGIKAIKIYSTHNVEYQIVRRFSESTTDILKKLASYIEWKRMEAYERRVWENFDFSIAVSENNKDIISKFIPKERVFVVLNGIDTGYFQPVKNTKTPFSIIYTGQMGWFPNEDAMLYFTSEMYPLIKKEVPDLKFFIVGSNTSAKVKKLAEGDESIKVTGRVEDIREYIDRAAVYIVPLRIGSGTRIKILEALAMEKPVISTTVGCEGLELTNGKEIVISDKPAEFANRVVSLLKDEKAGQRLGEAGRKVIKEKYDWEVVFNQLDKLIDKLGSSVGSAG